MSKQIHIKIIIPINSSFYNDIVLTAIRSAASKDTILSIENIKEGKYSIESHEDSKINAPYIAELIKQAEVDEYDGVFVSDMDMSGIQLAKEKYGIKIPLHGGFSSNIPVAAKRGNFIIMTILERIIDMQKNFAKVYGDGKFVDIFSINAGVHEIHINEDTMRILFEKTCEALEKTKKRNIKSIVFGCSAFIDFAEHLQNMLADSGYADILVIDPNRTAIQVLEKEIQHLKKIR